MVAFASGGRLRSEIAGLRKEQLTNEPPITPEDGTTLPSLAVHFDRTRTSGADHDEVFHLTGRPVDGLNAWLEAARIDTGSVPRYRLLWQGVQTRD